MYIAAIQSSSAPINISFDETKEGALSKARAELSKAMGLDLDAIEGFFLFEDEMLSVELMSTTLSAEQIRERINQVASDVAIPQLVNIFDAELCCQA